MESDKETPVKELGDVKSALNMNKLAESIATEMLSLTFDMAVNQRTKEILAFARKWKADIPVAQEELAINELKTLFQAPTSWPMIRVVSSNANVSTALTAAPKGRKKGDSDKEPTTGRKADSFAKLVLPEGMAPILCPAQIQSGKRQGNACGKVCGSLTDDHDPKLPECAAFKCRHMYCGTHITKAGKLSGTAAMKRLESASTSSDTIVTNTDGNSVVIPTKELTEVNPGVTAAAGKSTLGAIFSKMNAKKEAAKAAAASNNNSNN